MPISTPHDLQLEGTVVRGEGPAELGHLSDVRPACSDDYVTFLQPGSRRGRIWSHAKNEDALIHFEVPGQPGAHVG